MGRHGSFPGRLGASWNARGVLLKSLWDLMTVRGGFLKRLIAYGKRKALITLGVLLGRIRIRIRMHFRVHAHMRVCISIFWRFGSPLEPFENGACGSWKPLGALLGRLGASWGALGASG